MLHDGKTRQTPPGQSNTGAMVSLVNKSGFGTTVTGQVLEGADRLTLIRACVGQDFQPMDCGPWVATGLTDGQ
jgi:copper(I)-binding protein